MARSKNTFAVVVEYYPLRALLFLLQATPLALSKALCRGVMRTLLSVMPKRRRLIQNQLLACFPELSQIQRNTLARQSLDHLASGLATLARIPSLMREGTEGIVEIKGVEHMEAAYRKGKGMITFTAHYGCWELMAVYVTHHYPRVSMLVRPLDNPRLDAMVTGVRSSGGGGVIDSRRVFKDGIQLLRNNGILGILVDQNFHKGGVFVDFFGRPAATSTLVPILARRTGCAMLPMHNIWRDGKVHIICEPPLTPSSNPDINAAIYEDTQNMTRIVEGWIREDPSQWLWLHNRWKRRPVGENPDPVQRSSAIAI